MNNPRDDIHSVASKWPLVSPPYKCAPRMGSKMNHRGPLCLTFASPGTAWSSLRYRWPASPYLPVRLLRKSTQHEFLYQVSNIHSLPVWLFWDTTLTHTSSRYCMQSCWQKYSLKYTYTYCGKEWFMKTTCKNNLATKYFCVRTLSQN